MSAATGEVIASLASIGGHIINVEKDVIDRLSLIKNLI